MITRTLSLSLAALVTLAGVSSNVLAQTAIPDLDPVALCKRNAAAIQQGDFIVKACLEQEQDSYNFLKAQWGKLNEQTRRVCIQNAAAIDQGYFLIRACIEQELEAKAAVDGFQFKR